DGDAAHDRRARLREVALRTLFTDGLPDAATAQPPDEDGRADQREEHRRAGGDEEGDHPSSSSTTARSSNGTVSLRSSWTVSWPLPATTTVSPARASARARAIAARRSSSTR